MSKQEQQYIRQLADKWMSGQLNAEERIHFEQWYSSFDDSESLLNVGRYSNEAELKAGIFNAINGKISNSASPKTSTLWRKVSYAAAALACIVGLTWFLKKDKSGSQPTTETAYLQDISAGQNKAKITLSNGRQITLNSAQQHLIIGAGKLSYADGTRLSAPEALSETLVASTPMGGTYEFTLPDGSRIWLNAASSITFPSNFEGQKRRIVRISGEAYLQVAKDKLHPFVVQSKGQELEVLGTHFNINAYEDEQVTRTTLVEGAISVNGQLLQPGQQSIVGPKGLRTVRVDTSVETAWREGEFIFEQESLSSIMRKISRWYNVEVVYQEGVNPDLQFDGEISRSSKLSAILKTLEKTGDIKFKIEGRRVVLIK